MEGQDSFLPHDERRCPGCGRRLGPDGFHKSSPYCRFCMRFQHALRRAIPYGRWLEAQGGVCALCGDPPREGRRFDIDHVHVPPAERDGFVDIRGLLCGRCNLLVGALEQRPELIEWAQKYLDAEPTRVYLPAVRTNRRQRRIPRL